MTRQAFQWTVPGAVSTPLLFAAIIFALVGSVTSPSCEAADTPKVGQKVEVKRSPFEDKWEEAVIIEERHRGTVYEVRLRNGDTDIIWLKDMRPLTKKANKAENQELRTWTDSTGKYKIEARFEGVEDGKVVLLKKDGSETRLPLDKLSKSDQTYVSKNKPSENPFDKGNTPSPAESIKNDSQQPQTPAVDLSGVRELVLKAPSSSSYQPDLGESISSVTGEVSVALPPKTNFLESATGIAVDLVNSRIFLSRANTMSRIIPQGLASATGEKSSIGAIDIIDIKRQKLVNSIPTTVALVVADAIAGKPSRILSH